MKYAEYEAFEVVFEEQNESNNIEHDDNIVDIEGLPVNG
jgi:hypothetical protein